MRNILKKCWLLFFCFNFCGCFGSLELNERLFVTAIAFDAAKAKKEKMLITIQAPVPAAMEQKEGGGKDKKPFITFSTEAETVGQGLANLQKRLERTIFIGHTHTLLFSQDFARNEGIEKALDFFKREQQVQRTAQLAVVEGEAREVFKVKPPLEDTPASYIFSLLMQERRSSFDLQTDLGKYLVLDGEVGIEPILARIKKNGRTLDASGAALIKKGKLAGWLTAREARGLSFLTGEFDFARFQIPYPRIKSRYVMVNLRNIRPAYRIKIDKKQNIEVAVHINGIFDTREFTFPMGPNKSMEKEVTTSVNRRIKNEAMMAVRKIQACNTDVLGVGRKIYTRSPGLWHKINWDEKFPAVKIKVIPKVTGFITIRRVGK